MLGKRDGREDETKTMATEAQAHEQNGQQQVAGAAQGQAKTKPLRFVTNYGAPHPKRRRIGAACLTCG